jgi:hypothetical protein
MMETLWTVKKVQERYNLKSPKTAIKYIRAIEGHMENPLGVHESDLIAWEESRKVYKPERQRAVRTRRTEAGTMYVPRHR